MEDLKEFYETQVRAKSPNLPAFKDADAETLKAVSKSITFAAWKLGRATNNVKNACRKITNKYNEYLKLKK